MAAPVRPLLRTFAASLSLAVVSACLPAFDNPFDPLNSPEGGPLRFTVAEQSGKDTVRLEWPTLDHPGITGWRVTRTNAGGTTEGAPDPLKVDLPRETTTYTDTGALAGATYDYRLHALAGTTESAPSPERLVTVEAPPQLQLSTERVGIGAVKVRWAPLPAWAASVTVMRECGEPCSGGTVGSAAATALELVDEMDEGPTVTWRASFTDQTGVTASESEAATEPFEFDLRGPYADDVERAIDAQDRIVVRFTGTPGAALHLGYATKAGESEPVVVVADEGSVTFTELDKEADYVIRLVASGPNERVTLPGPDIVVGRRVWREFQPERFTHAVEPGPLTALAWQRARGSTPDLLQLLASTLSGNPTQAVSTQSCLMERRGGFSKGRTDTVPAFAPPFVALQETGFRWVSPVSSRAIDPSDNGAVTSLTTGGDAPSPFLHRPAAAVNPEDGTIWIHGGELSAITQDELRKGVFDAGSGAIQWTLMSPPPLFGSRVRHAMAFHRGELYMLGGAFAVGGTGRFFAKWRPGEPGGTSLASFGGGPTNLANVALASDGVQLWAAGGEQSAMPIEEAVWTFDETSGWLERSVGALGPAPTGSSRSILPFEFRYGRGLLVHDGSNLFQFEPVDESGSKFRWVRIDAPPDETTFKGAYDVDADHLYLKGSSSLWRFAPTDATAWTMLASAPGRDWPAGAIGWDGDEKRLLTYNGGDAVLALDPDAAAPAFTQLLSAAGGPTSIDVHLLQIGASLQDFESPTLFASGYRGEAPEGMQVWSVRLDGTQPWRRHDVGDPPPFLQPGTCVPAPVSCWDPRSPSVYAAGLVNDGGITAALEVWRVDLSSGSPTWVEVYSKPAGGCPMVESMSCTYGSGHAYLYGTFDLAPGTWRVDLDRGSDTMLPMPAPEAGPGLRTKPTVVHRPSWNDLLLFGGRTPVGHDVWRLEIR